MKLNILKLAHLVRPRTHEGAPAAVLTPERALRRSILACMLWENEFYEDGMTIASRIRELVPRVAAEKVAALAVEARTSMKLRHAPLLLVREMGQLKNVQLHVVAPPSVRVGETSPGNSDTASYMSLRQAVRLPQHSRQGSNLRLHLAVALYR